MKKLVAAVCSMVLSGSVMASGITVSGTLDQNVTAKGAKNSASGNGIADQTIGSIENINVSGKLTQKVDASGASNAASGNGRATQKIGVIKGCKDSGGSSGGGGVLFGLIGGGGSSSGGCKD